MIGVCYTRPMKYIESVYLTLFIPPPHTSSPGITPGISSVKEGSEKGRTKYTTIVSCQKIDIKEIKAKQRTQINQVGTQSNFRMTNQMSAYVKLHWF